MQDEVRLMYPWKSLSDFSLFLGDANSYIFQKAEANTPSNFTTPEREKKTH